ncbi:MAG: AAA family ATPase [Solirubrobacteraceae bacterium]|jgi:predicted AAA+ superfamily ATPase
MPETKALAGSSPRGRYTRRIVDDELDELIAGLPAIALEGPKAVGKTATALQRAATVYRLDDEAERSIAQADPSRLIRGERPVLIDEWQRLPEVFDRVRRAVDESAPPGSFLLTGSASPIDPPTHSGAGRIVQVRLRPMTLAERGFDPPTVSLRALLDGKRPPVDGQTSVDLEDYVKEILASGFPGLRGLPERLARAQLDGYIDRIIDRDFDELGRKVRRPATLRSWMQAYAAATSTTTSYEKIRDAATSGHGDKPSRATTQPYRDILERLWILDPVPAWLPTRSRLARLSAPPKHHLADPALAARLLGADATTLLHPSGTAAPITREGTLLGALFESLVTLCVRVYAQAAEARTSHLRTWSGDREIDLIVERGHKVLAVEAKLGHTPDERDVRHLNWLRDELGAELADAIIITTGTTAYRRADGIAVIPAVLLGP